MSLSPSPPLFFRSLAYMCYVVTVANCVLFPLLGNAIRAWVRYLASVQVGHHWPFSGRKGEALSPPHVGAARAICSSTGSGAANQLTQNGLALGLSGGGAVAYLQSDGLVKLMAWRKGLEQWWTPSEPIKEHKVGRPGSASVDPNHRRLRVGILTAAQTFVRAAT